MKSSLKTPRKEHLEPYKVGDVWQFSKPVNLKMKVCDFLLVEVVSHSKELNGFSKKGNGKILATNYKDYNDYINKTVIRLDGMMTILTQRTYEWGRITWKKRKKLPQHEADQLRLMNRL